MDQYSEIIISFVIELELILILLPYMFMCLSFLTKILKVS